MGRAAPFGGHAVVSSPFISTPLSCPIAMSKVFATRQSNSDFSSGLGVKEDD